MYITNSGVKQRLRSKLICIQPLLVSFLIAFCYGRFANKLIILALTSSVSGKLLVLQLIINVSRICNSIFYGVVLYFLLNGLLHRQ
jgi:hypothetical protein